MEETPKDYPQIFLGTQFCSSSLYSNAQYETTNGVKTSLIPGGVVCAGSAVRAGHMRFPPGGQAPAAALWPL